ncbi:rhamnan synthesis F family protein [Phreatobacter stygius]|nr:rhamnan synthesis F family protein [Phreatobacter stygius]
MTLFSKTSRIQAARIDRSRARSPATTRSIRFSICANLAHLATRKNIELSVARPSSMETRSGRRECFRLVQELEATLMRRVQDYSYRTRRRTPLARLRARYSRLFLHLDNVRDIVGGSCKDLLLKSSLMRLAPPEVHHNHPLFPDGSRPRRLCLFASYSKTSVVSDMVLEQLRAYRQAGFSIVFVSMSAGVSKPDLERLSGFCATVIRRDNHGLDFGAWADALRLLAGETTGLDSLLLTNDSNIGPISPLGPWIEKCLASEGIFGLTESLQGGAHLQSYFLLGHGRRATEDLTAFLRKLRVSFSKWILIQRGEIGLTSAMRQRHFVAAVIDHETLENAVLDDIEAQLELSVVCPDLFANFAIDQPPSAGIHDLQEARRIRDRYGLRRRLFNFPLNPTHQLASVLVKTFKFPFIKTELIVKNPARMPFAPDWRYCIDDQSPCSVEMIERHIAGR